MFARELTDFGKWFIIPKTQFLKRNSRWNITFYLRIFRPKCLAWRPRLRWALALTLTASSATTLWWKSPQCSPSRAARHHAQKAAEKWTRIRTRTCPRPRRTDRSLASTRGLPSAGGRDRPTRARKRKYFPARSAGKSFRRRGTSRTTCSATRKCKHIFYIIYRLMSPGCTSPGKPQL